jgi:hypothetical protein
MRTDSIAILAAVIILASCSDHFNPPPAEGTLIVSTSTVGGDPDRDGFELTIDGVNSIDLEPIDSVEVVVSAGRHTLGLLGVAGQCSVDPGIPHEVEIPLEGGIPVSFAVNCPAVGARVTTTTTGLDIDQDGYLVTVDGIDQAPIPSNAVAFIRGESGSRRIALTGVAPNCASASPVSQTVTIVPNEPTPIEFAVVCTATTGVIEVSLSTSGTDTGGPYQVFVDGVQQSSQFHTSSEPEAIFVEAIFVSGGDHLLSLTTPSNCSVEAGPQTVNVTVGGLVRDTVGVNFAVSCTPAPPEGNPWGYNRASNTSTSSLP